MRKNELPASRALAAPLLAALLLAAAATTTQAQTGPSPGRSTDAGATPPPGAIMPSGATPSLAPRPARRDLYLDMPYYLGGYEPAIVMVRGQEHFTQLAADDPARTALEGMLDRLGASVADMVSGYALVSQPDLFSFVLGIRIPGVTPGSFLPAYLPVLLASLQDPVLSTAIVGGKEVTVVTSLGDDGEPADLDVYDQGDTLWIVQGPPDVSEVALEGLPPPGDTG